MLIALLAVLGVDLVAILALAAFVFTRKRWVNRQPGAFRGAVRVAGGEVDGLGPTWRRGDARWVRDVFVCVKTGEAAVEVAAHSDDAELLPGPYSEKIGATLAATTTQTVAAAGSEGG